MSLQTEIRGVHLTDGYYNVIPALTIPRVANASSVDHDVKEQRLYWTDVQRKSINRAFINGSDIETVIEGKCWNFMYRCSIVSNKWSRIDILQLNIESVFIKSFWSDHVLCYSKAINCIKPLNTYQLSSNGILNHLHQKFLGFNNSSPNMTVKICCSWWSFAGVKIRPNSCFERSYFHVQNFWKK